MEEVRFEPGCHDVDDAEDGDAGVLLDGVARLSNGRSVGHRQWRAGCGEV